jgi:hypothetical protein
VEELGRDMMTVLILTYRTELSDSASDELVIVVLLSKVGHWPCYEVQ